MWREQKRRNGLETTIGHAKFDHRTARNYLLGYLGDGISAPAAASGYNLHRIIDATRRLCDLIMLALSIDMARSDASWPPRQVIG